jgi:D-alanine-D-alanine ligase
VPLNVGITYNLRPETAAAANLPTDAWEEFDSEETIDAIARVLQEEGHRVAKLGGDAGLLDRLTETSFDIVFNIAEGIGGRNREAHIPALLEFLKIPYAGSDPLTLSVTLDKAMAKRIVSSEGVPTPRFRVVSKTEEARKLDLVFPLFVKLCYEGSSKGVRLNSRVSDRASLEERVDWLLRSYGPPVLVEEFVSGPEFTVGIIGNDPPAVLGVMQIEITGIPEAEAIYSLEIKRDWKERVRYHCPPGVAPDLLTKIEDVALRSYRALDCRDVARVDIRVGSDGTPHFLEVNPLPGLSPTYGDLPIMARAAGWDYPRLVKTIFRHALNRYGLAGDTAAPRAPST